MDIKQLYSYFLKSSGISTDTRKLQTNKLFFALSGENFNGNSFAEEALASGAQYAVIDDENYKTINRTILVKDCLQTLQELATYHRKILRTPIIALTGSNGKTTTKELINTVLSKKFETTATQGNLNNHIGVPLTLLKMTRQTEIGIVEMGANHLKEIEKLCNIALPDYGYITNFGKAHLEGFGSEEGVIKGKSELYKHIINHGGLLFINNDDEKQVALSEKAKKYCFGSATSTDVALHYPPARPFAKIEYEENHIKSQLTGQYNAVNMAAALTIGLYFDVDLTKIQEAINSYIPANNRSQIIKKGNLNILLDAYNANPTSMEAALSNLSSLKATHKIVILGDMFELGKTTSYEHRELLNRALDQHYDAIIAVGKHFKEVAINKDNLFFFENVEEVKKNLSEELKKLLKMPVFILIKGSRGMALERLVPFLEEQAQ